MTTPPRRDPTPRDAPRDAPKDAPRDAPERAARDGPPETRWLEMQGFTCAAGLPQEHRWLRFTPVLSGLWIVLGVVLVSPWILWAFALVSAVGALRERHPFDHLHERLVRRMVDAPSLPPNPPPRRFAMAVAALWAAATGALFAGGLVATGIVLGTVLIVAAATVASSHFCLGSWAYRRIGSPFG